MAIPQDLADRPEKAIAAIQTASDAIFSLMSSHTHEDGHHLLVERVGDQTIIIDRACRDLASPRRSAPASGETGEAWVAAIDVPKEWEGKLAWRWRDWDQSLGVQQDTIPYNFDRSPGSCRGVYFMLLSRPSSPTPSGETRGLGGSL